MTGANGKPSKLAYPTSYVQARGRTPPTISNMSHPSALNRLEDEGTTIERVGAIQAHPLLITSRILRACWFATPSRMLSQRRFGAWIGSDVIDQHQFRTGWRRRSRASQNATVSERYWLLQFEVITIGSKVSVSSRSFSSANNTDGKFLALRFNNAPVRTERKGWLATRAIIRRTVMNAIGAFVVEGCKNYRDLPVGLMSYPPQAAK